MRPIFRNTAAISLQIALGGTEAIQLDLIGARAKASGISDAKIDSVILGGALTEEDLNTKVIPHTYLNAMRPHGFSDKIQAHTFSHHAETVKTRNPSWNKPSGQNKLLLKELAVEASPTRHLFPMFTDRNITRPKTAFDEGIERRDARGEEGQRVHSPN